MHLDRFDGYPDYEEIKEKKPTALQLWMALGYDPSELKTNPVSGDEEETAKEHD